MIYELFVVDNSNPKCKNIITEIISFCTIE